MRRILLLLSTAAVVGAISLAAPGGAQTDTTFPPNPGMLGELVITGAVVCTEAQTYEITWTLENLSETKAIGFFYAWAAPGFAQDPGDPQRTDLDLADIEPGASSTVVVSYPGSSTGQHILQTEAYFVGEEPYAGPVPGVVVLDGSCAPPSTGGVGGGTAGTASARVATATPTYTG